MKTFCMSKIKFVSDAHGCSHHQLTYSGDHYIIDPEMLYDSALPQKPQQLQQGSFFYQKFFTCFELFHVFDRP